MNQLKILSIDDEKLFTHMLSNLLRHDYKITTAHSGREGLSILKKDKFDLILLDYSMPEMNGIEVLHEIKKINGHIPVIFLSGDLSLDEDELIKKGAVALLTKPFAIDEMMDILNKVAKKNKKKLEV